METREHMTPAEAAEALGVTKKTVIRWFKSGHLGGYQLSPRIIRIYRDEVAAALKGEKQ